MNIYLEPLADEKPKKNHLMYLRFNKTPISRSPSPHHQSKEKPYNED